MVKVVVSDPESRMSTDKNRNNIIRDALNRACIAMNSPEHFFVVEDRNSVYFNIYEIRTKKYLGFISVKQRRNVGFVSKQYNKKNKQQLDCDLDKQYESFKGPISKELVGVAERIGVNKINLKIITWTAELGWY